MWKQEVERNEVLISNVLDRSTTQHNETHFAPLFTFGGFFGAASCECGALWTLCSMSVNCCLNLISDVNLDFGCLSPFVLTHDAGKIKLTFNLSTTDVLKEQDKGL